MTVYNAPPVIYPVGRSRFHACLLLGLWLAGAVVTLLWTQSAVLAPGGALLAGLLVLCLAGLAFRVWIQAPEGQLAWDGEVWRWQSASYQAGEATYRLTVGTDLQRVLLLRLENSDRASLWLWVDAARQPDRWLDLRRAVYSPGRTARSGRPDSPQLPAAGQGVAVSGAMQQRARHPDTHPALRARAQDGGRP